MSRREVVNIVIVQYIAYYTAADVVAAKVAYGK